MTCCEIRNFDDLRHVYASASAGATIDELRFDGWPLRILRSDYEMSDRRKRKALADQQRVVNRLYAAARYGEANHRLNEAELALIELGVRHHEDNRGITIDFSRAANTYARLAIEHQRVGLPDFLRQVPLLAYRAVVDDSSSVFNDPLSTLAGRVPKEQAAGTLLLAITTIAIVAGLVAGVEVILEHRRDVMVAANEQKQLDLNRPVEVTVAVLDGHLKAVVASEVAAQIEAERQVQYEMLAKLQHDPWLRFASFEAERALPSLMRVAPLVGMTDFGHGQSVDGKKAHAAAKKLVQNQRATTRPKPPTSGWITTTTRA